MTFFVTVAILITFSLILKFIICIFDIFYPTKEKCFNNIWSENDRQLMYKLLKEVTLCLERKNVRHYAAFGTLLGLMRHKDIIPHDDDVDIAYFESDKQNLLKAFEEMQKYNIEYIKPRENLIGEEYFRVYYKNTTKLPFGQGEYPYIDIFESRDLKNMNSKEKQQTFIFPSGKQPFETKSLLPLVKRKFGPLMIYTPKDPFLHLDSEFGKDRYSDKGYMKLIVGSNFNHFLQVPCFCHFLTQPLK